MYKIDRKKDKPDIGYAEATISKLLSTRGIRIDINDEVKNYYSEQTKRLYELMQSKYNIANPNSPKQVAAFLELQAAKFSLGKRNDIIEICYDDVNEKWKTDADRLGKLSDLGYEFANDLLEYRKASKYKGCLDSLLKSVDSNSIAHPHVRLAGTNRFSYYNPGLLTIPKDILWNVIKPLNEDNTLYSVDIKNQEPVILINMTGAKELRTALESDEGLYESAFKQCFKPKCTANVLVDTLPENRVYSAPELTVMGTVSPAYYCAEEPQIKSIYYNDKKVVGISKICLGSEKGLKPNLPETINIETEDEAVHSVKVTWDEKEIEKRYKKSADYVVTGTLDDLEVRVSKAERREFKVAWLAITYGSSAFSIKNMCKIIDGKAVYDYITKIEGLKEYRSLVDKKAKAGETSICTIFGTPLFITDSDTLDTKALKRKLLNIPIQGSAADILSLLIKRFYDYKEEHNLENSMELYFTRHDEFVIEVSKDWQDKVGEEVVKDTLKDIFEHQIDDWTPFKLEIEKIESSI